ncbi:MAG: ATP-dependent Clp protease ATP-binding subunit [Actinobacteria bacterium]|nr:ATP-dependent Clp protease ATP-binding subunit [Actinomycetota bacterium]
MRDLSEHPIWLRDIDAALPVTASFVVSGNIRDLYLLPHSSRPKDAYAALWDTLRRSGFEAIVLHTPSALRVLPLGDSAAMEAACQVLGTKEEDFDAPVGPDELARHVRSVLGTSARRVALVVDYVSQWNTSGESVAPADLALFRTALESIHAAHSFRYGSARRSALYNPLIWLVDRPADLPEWLVGGSDLIRQVPIPSPDLDDRLDLTRRLTAGMSPDGAAAEAGARRFAELTEGMTLRSLLEIRQLSMDQEIGLDHIDDAVRAFRIGVVTNPWARRELQQRIRDGAAHLTRRVKGQDRAVRHALDILLRSTTGMTGAETGRPVSGPRGILFFAGPTGVGKTELAKAITALVFGDERAYIRFDMSEFASEHTEARLIGSPPGYVGHGQGGELTNAVRQKPFALILFDEIEKAHPRILDKFLQILSDGRLTDGSGATVHFSESLIVFTSNLGVPPVPDGEEPPRGRELEETVQAAITDAFEHDLHRPELLGRIGDNIVVFDYISPDIARVLASDFIDNILARAHQTREVRLRITDDVRAHLVEEAIADLSKGGRGIGRNLERILVNPLARALFDLEPGRSATITDVRREEAGWYTVSLA